MTAEKLKKLIDKTHKHGLQLEKEIKVRRHAPAKKALLKWLKLLNARRHKELERKEHPKAKRAAARFKMYDAVTIENIPPNPPAVAGYVDGKYANYGAMVSRFPNAKHLGITIRADHDARALDIEIGDATPQQAPGWVRKQHARGIKRPIVYANTSTMPSVISELKASGILRGEYLVWTAHYTGTPHIEPGSDATQYEDHEERYDVSLCEPYFL